MSALHPVFMRCTGADDDRRDCYTCAFSPPFPNPPDCAALTMDEAADTDIVDFCERSGANDHGGWPPADSRLSCPRWIAR